MDDLQGQLKEVVRHLGDGEWHSLFSIHDRFRLSPDAIAKCVEYLERNDFIVFDGRYARIKDEINDEMVSEIMYIFLCTGLSINDDSKFVPGQKQKVDELYLPRFDILGKELIDYDL